MAAQRIEDLLAWQVGHHGVLLEHLKCHSSPLALGPSPSCLGGVEAVLASGPRGSGCPVAAHAWHIWSQGGFPWPGAVAGNSNSCSTTAVSVLYQTETAGSSRFAKPCIFPLAIGCSIRIKPSLPPWFLPHFLLLPSGCDILFEPGMNLLW